MSAERQSDPNVAAVRRALVKQADDYLGYWNAFLAAADGNRLIQDIDNAPIVACNALASAGTFMHALAAVIRVVELNDAGTGLRIAQLVDAVMDSGMDALLEANADLDEQAREVEDATAGAVI